MVAFGKVVESFWSGARLVERGHDRQTLEVRTQFWFQPVPSASWPVTMWGGKATQPGHQRACHSASSLLHVEDRNPQKGWFKTNLSFLKLLLQVFCDSHKSYSSHANRNTMFSSIWSLDYCLKMEKILGTCEDSTCSCTHITFSISLQLPHHVRAGASRSTTLQFPGHSVLTPVVFSILELGGQWVTVVMEYRSAHYFEQNSTVMPL